MDDFLIRAGVAGIGVAVVAGPLGVFVVWRRMAYFGATLAHSALLGIALGMLLGVGAATGVVLVGGLAAVALVALQGGRRTRVLSADTQLGIIAHGALALGLVAASTFDAARFDLMGYLFGDILAVGASDIAWILGGGAVVLAGLVLLWRPLLAVTVDEETARVEGVPVTAVNLAFMLLLAVVVALAMKVVGILLVASLLIIPAAAARRFAWTPEGMAAGAALAGCLSVIGGLWGSLTYDIPAGPGIVVAALILYAAGVMMPVIRRPRSTRVNPFHINKS
jgi:zinc transport system permease protein